MKKYSLYQSSGDMFVLDEKFKGYKLRQSGFEDSDKSANQEYITLLEEHFISLKMKNTLLDFMSICQLNQLIKRVEYKGLYIFKTYNKIYIYNNEKLLSISPNGAWDITISDDVERQINQLDLNVVEKDLSYEQKKQIEIFLTENQKDYIFDLVLRNKVEVKEEEPIEYKIEGNFFFTDELVISFSDISAIEYRKGQTLFSLKNGNRYEVNILKEGFKEIQQRYMKKPTF